ncbi:MAG: amino acid ABC transporter substrate-binding protein [Deltaproteobacteria bacterium]|nr:amino acid ABC transporter substrate-binding protein [Deltaproteobacteria bacterium]
MKNKAIFIIFVFLFINVGLVVYAEPVKVTFGYQDSKNYPFQTGDGLHINWEKPGIAIEMIQLIEKKVNIDITFKRFPWKRGLVGLEKGTIDGLFSASYKPTRLKFGAYPMKNGQIDQDRRSYYNSYCLYKINGSPISWNGIEFANLKYGLSAVRGFSIVDDLRKKGISVYESSNTTKCMDLLIHGRVDGVAALELAGDSILRGKKNIFGKIIKVKPPLRTKAYYLMLSHQFIGRHSELSEAIWDAIAEVRESDELEMLNKKYLH